MPVKDVDPSPIGRAATVGLPEGLAPSPEPPERDEPSDGEEPPEPPLHPASATAAVAPAPTPSIPLREKVRM
ncbi:hypothetical protein GCM10020256_31770 [Streptomyces thermocoprophilus]